MLSKGASAPVTDLIRAVIDEIANFLLELYRRFAQSLYGLPAAPRYLLLQLFLRRSLLIDVVLLKLRFLPIE